MAALDPFDAAVKVAEASRELARLAAQRASVEAAKKEAAEAVARLEAPLEEARAALGRAQAAHQARDRTGRLYREAQHAAAGSIFTSTPLGDTAVAHMDAELRSRRDDEAAAGMHQEARLRVERLQGEHTTALQRWGQLCGWIRHLDAEAERLTAERDQRAGSNASTGGEG